MPSRTRFLLAAALLLALPGRAAGGGSGNRLAVGPGKPFTTIQAAVDASVDGDTILVDAGTYNESVLIEGKQRLTLLGGRPESTLIIGTASHGVEIRAGGGLATAAPAGDTQALVVGRGEPFSTCVSAGADTVLDTAVTAGDDQIVAILGAILSGSNGVCETTADVADTQALPVGQGTPNSSCVDAGTNGTLDTTPAGDDVATTMPEAIDSGPDGICDTTAVTGDDVRNIDTNMITSGADGICTTTAAVGDLQTVLVGNGAPNTDCVRGGFDNDLDTGAGVGDDGVDVPNLRVTTGANGICETAAAAGDLQAVAVGRGTPNGACVTAGTPLKRGRQVKVQAFTIRAPDGFDGVFVERSDFVELASLVLDASTRVFNGVCTAAGVPFTCCTGPGAGKCSPNDSCAGANNPFACCTAKATGNCASNDTCTGAGVPLSCCTGSGAGICMDRTGRNGILVDFTAIKPIIKSTTAKLQRASGFFIGGPGAEVSGCTADRNDFFGFAQFQSSDSAIYTGNTATQNNVGFGLAGQGNIIQRCVASANATVGFDVFGVGNVLFQVTSIQNGQSTGSGTGIRTIGRGTRIRSSVITGNTNFGIFLTRDDGIPPDPNITAQGSEVFANVVRDNRNGGIVDEEFGVVMKQNTVETSGATRQDVGIWLRGAEVGGTLLESNIIRNNRDVDGDVCGAGVLCDLVNQGTNNAGRLNLFSLGFTPPPGFQ